MFYVANESDDLTLSHAEGWNTRHWLSSGDHRCECVMWWDRRASVLSRVLASQWHYSLTDVTRAWRSQPPLYRDTTDGAGRAGRPGRGADGRTVECVRWSASNLIILASLMTLARRGHDNDIMPDWMPACSACMAAAVMVAGRRRWSGLLNNLVQPCSDNDANHSVRSLRQTRPPPLCFTAIVHVTVH